MAFITQQASIKERAVYFCDMKIKNLIQKNLSTGEIILDFDGDELITTKYSGDASSELVQKFLNYINQTTDREQLCIGSKVRFCSNSIQFTLQPLILAPSSLVILTIWSIIT